MIYDEIGRGYSSLRVPDTRIRARIQHALGRSQSVVNIGAGAGSYEPSGIDVTAVEPSHLMISQRAPSKASVVRAAAENLPFADAAFDAAMAVMTMHHWTDWRIGIREMQRVARRIVILTFDAAVDSFWLTKRYFPQISLLDQEMMPSMEDLGSELDGVQIETVEIPHDCTDGFLGAYWRRPHLYLEDRVRSAISAFSLIDGVKAGIERLATDLKCGTWDQEYGHLRAQEALDVGYRLLIWKGRS